MPITFPCSGCAARLRVGSQMAGRSAACPSCRARITVPRFGLSVSRRAPAVRVDSPERPRLLVVTSATSPVPPVPPTLPTRNLAAGLALLVLLGAIGSVVAYNLRGKTDPAEEQEATPG